MATRFEIALHGDNPVSLRAAGEEALAEVERLEAQLSLFRPGSEIARLNAWAAQQPVRVTPAVFALLEHARRLWEETRGTFDITIAPLVRCWGFMGGSGHLASPEQVAEARSRTGMHLVHLDPAEFTVRFERAGVMLDLGAIGKGYAIERAAELLREAGVTSALLHGGTSTVYALGHPPEAEFWQVAIERPHGAAGGAPGSGSGRMPADQPASPEARKSGSRSDGAEAAASAGPLAVVKLKDEALSVSAIWGKCFQAEGKTLGHIIDPRSGRPATGALLAAVALPSATETDALSTALLTLGFEGHDHIADLRPGVRTLVLAESGGELRVEARGMAWNAPN